MQILIVSIIYAVAAVILLSFAVKNFLKMNDKNNQIYRQYFFTLLFLLFILIASFITVLLRLKPHIFIGDGSGSEFFIGENIKEGYGLIKYIISVILGIVLLSLFDRYFLKRKSKTEREYHMRRRLTVGIVILLTGIITAIRLILKG